MKDYRGVKRSVYLRLLLVLALFVGRGKGIDATAVFADQIGCRCQDDPNGPSVDIGFL